MPRGTAVEIQTPVLGTRYDFPPNKVPEGAMSDSQNAIIYLNRIVTRPGLTPLITGTFGEQVLGVMYYTLNDLTSRLVAAGATTWKQVNMGAGTWTNITGAALSGTLDDPVRFIVWPEGTSTYLIGVNNTNTPKEWNGLAATYSDLTGLSQWTTAKDITAAANRIVVCNTIEAGVRYPFRVRFSDFNTRSAWTLTNFIDLPETNDTLVANRALNRTAFAVLGKNSQWVATARSGVFPFTIELQDQMPGPASPSAVIPRMGVLYWMGSDGTFYLFDGVRVQHIGDPIRKKVQDNVNFSTIGRSHGFYRSRDRSLWWFFPTTANNPTNAVQYVLPSSEAPYGAWTHHQFASNIDVTASGTFTLISGLTWDTLPIAWTWDTIDLAYPSWDSFSGVATPEELLGNGTNTQVYRFRDSGQDDVNNISAFFEMPVPPLTPGFRKRVDAVESEFLVPGSATTCTIAVGSTDTMGTAPQYPVALQGNFDLSVDTRHLLDLSTATTGEGTATDEAQFMFVKHTISGSVPWEWRGTRVFTETQRVE